MSIRLAMTVITALAVSCASPASMSPDGQMDESTAGGAGGAMQPPPVIGGQLPCEISQIFTAKCHQCHGPVKSSGVPMSLVTWADTHSMSITPGNDAKTIFQRISERIHDPLNPMPPRIYAQLTPEEMGMLDAWVAQGAPEGAACMAPPASTAPAGTGSAPGTGGTGAGGTVTGTGGTVTGTGGSIWEQGGGTTGIPLDDGGVLEPAPEDRPVEPDPAECTWVDLKARGDANGAPYTVAANAFEQYRCFGFNIPEFASQPTQALAFYTINEALDAPWVHHWLLYQTGTPQTNGSSADCLGTHLDAALVAGWAPGATPWFLPSHVGIDLSANFILEVHYNNPGGPATADTSGVRVCTTTDLRPESASVSWLGSDFFPAIPPGAQGHETKSRCTPQISEPIHILRTWPHMHLLGRAMRAKMIRANGDVIPYHDQVFDFSYQVQYDTPIILNPGDSVETTCVYDNPTGNFVGFGQGTTQEMCYNFTVAYPANALKNALPSVHTNACLNEAAP